MKKTKLLISLALILMFTMILGQSVVFAQDAPPVIDSPFGDDGDDTPPALTGGDDDDDDEPPALTGDDDDDDDDDGTPPPPPDDDDGTIPESGPEIAFLLVPSLALGYAYRKKKNRK